VFFSPYRTHLKRLNDQSEIQDHYLLALLMRNPR